MSTTKYRPVSNPSLTEREVVRAVKHGTIEECLAVPQLVADAFGVGQERSDRAFLEARRVEAAQAASTRADLKVSALARTVLESARLGNEGAVHAHLKELRKAVNAGALVRSGIDLDALSREARASLDRFSRAMASTMANNKKGTKKK